MKFLEDPMQTIGAGFALAVVLIVVFLGLSGVGAGEVDWVGMIMRWTHFLAGITWIGLLYFFNLINAAFLKSLDGPTKNIVIPKLMPSALNWFRHGATVTVLAGLVRQYGRDAATGEPLGMCGLIRRDYLDAPDIGFAYLARHCGRGYGHEAGTATLDYGRKVLGLHRILGITQPDNAASIALLNKLGLRAEGTLVAPSDGKTLLVYSTSPRSAPVSP